MAEKIEKCPICGGEMRLTYFGVAHTYTYLSCTRCHYRAGRSKDRAKLIAAHNRVSRNNAAADADAGLFDAVDALFFAQIAKGMITLETETHPDESLNPLWQAYLKQIEAIDNE